MALVGSYVALSKPLVAVFGVYLLAWARFGIGAIAMAGWARPLPGTPAMRASQWLWVFALSLFGNVLFSVFMLNGVQRTSASTAGVIMASLPAVVAILSAWLLKERLSARAALAIGLAVIAIAVFASEQPDTQASQWLGNLLVFAAVCCEAMYVVIAKKLAGHLSAKRMSALINRWGLLMMTPLALGPMLDFSLEAVPPSSWALLLFYGLAASVWTVVLWVRGLQTIPAHQAGVFTVMLPISATVVGVVFLGEELTGLQTVAMGVALMGVVLITTSSRGHLTK